MSDHRYESAQRLDRSTAALMLWGLMSAVATLSVGLALAGWIPIDTPTAVPVMLTAALLALHAAALRLEESARQTPSTPRLGPALAGLIAPTLAGFAWSPAGSITAMIAILALMLLATAGVIVWNTVGFVRREEATDQQPVTAPLTVRGPIPATSPGLSPEWQDVAQNPDSGTEEASVSLRLVRREIDGQDVLDVTARLEFPAGVKQVAWHLPITPAMSEAPEVECEPLDEADVELSVGAVYPYGLRIDARRSDTASAMTTMIGVQAIAPQMIGRAAA